MVPASRDGREGPCEMQAPGKHPGNGAGRVCVSSSLFVYP